MTLEFKSKIVEGIQQLTLNNGITTFIGGNGSGKSSILESIFETYIENDDFRVICFSSGQNELFSEIFNKHKRTNRRYLRERNETIQSFYFNSEWIKLLIFWATIFKENGLVRKYLLEKNYINVDALNDDISTKLHFRFRIRKDYVLSIRNEIEQEELGTNVSEEGYEIQENLLRKTEFHETLEKIITAFDIDFDFQNNDNLVKRWLTFDSKKAYEVFTHKDINMVFSFWALATNGWLSNSELSEFNLSFSDIEFKHLSDGEYQILSTYAIIDLFDDENTIFLFDEIDSHLYYENLNKMWNVLKNSRGIIITTTHISESILQNKIENIKVIEGGKIEESLTFFELSKRLDNIVGQKNYQFKILSRVEYPVIMDNLSDWIIFKKLVVKKFGEESLLILDKFLPIAKSSSFDTTNEIFGHQKLYFVEEFRKENLGKTILTKNIFLICDKDELPLNQIGADMKVAINQKFDNIKKFNNNNNTKTHLLSWKRREIENYLLSPSLFTAKNCTNDINALYNLPNYSIGDNLDNISDFKIGDFKTILRPFYNMEGSGFNEEMLTEMISHINPTEISNDINLMYNYLKNTIAL
ncbi:hypothetical protein SAMN05443633_103270 [Chryseobacterium arachidis]|uniref:Uncharacterized protein n=2 Tax=Chryseobacterium arachidis TaxID=1416778 RepID=A0A1M4ZUS6_9FLAO|nr:AAA family ATPase [Chryseobacterium arachidis]SHF21557.1 hypothetical protein SAMN05443633_103270 [Chryseobacterium arachidis]